MSIVVKQLLPIAVLGLSLILVIFSRNSPLLEFESIGFDTVFLLTAFYVFATFGYFVGSLGLIVKRKDTQRYSYREVNRKGKWLLILAWLSILCTLVKIFQEAGVSDLSLSAITEHRLDRARNEYDAKGGTVFGVLGNITSGFVIAIYVFSRYYETYLTKRTMRVVLFTFILGVAVSFFGGGRFAAVFAVLFIVIFRMLMRLSENRGFRAVFVKNGFLKGRSIFTLLIAVAFFAVLMHLFLIRFEYSDTLNNSYISYINLSLEGVSVPQWIERQVDGSAVMSTLYFVLAMLLYYIGHAFYQFGVLVGYGEFSYHPYLLGYQMYPFWMLLNKVGFDFISIQTILADIPTAGHYFTLAGAFYLDFGLTGSFIAIAVFFLLGALAWARAIRNRGFISMFVASLFLIVVIFSPIVSAIGTANFPSLLTVACVLWLFRPLAIFDSRKVDEEG